MDRVGIGADPVGMDWLRAHTPAVVMVVGAVAGAAAVFTVARPTYHASRLPEVTDNSLPYPHVSYTTADVRRVFAVESIALTPRVHGQTVTTLGNERDILEVDVFGDPKKVKQSGFHDYTVASGRYVRFPRRCFPGARDAERWHGNVRVIVDCAAAGAAPNSWLARAARALARL
jgi:hypothetical protein